jgi:DNA-binding MarR family transcriptional regulator
MRDSTHRPASAPPPTSVSASGIDESTGALRNALRELRIELAIGTRRVAAATGLNDSDLDVLDVLARYGGQSPTVLARRMGIHPATMTGVLARLEKAGWIVRRRDVIDRRSVQVEPSGFDRLTELYSGAGERLDRIAAQLDPKQRAVILDYLNQATAAVRDASAGSAGQSDAGSQTGQS